MASLATRRLQAELKNFPSNDLPYEVVDCSNLMCWKVRIAGAENTLYQGEQFYLQFKFSDSYPISSPEVIFVDSIPIHEHVYSNGHICLSILYDEWAASLTVDSVCLSIISVLSSATEKKTPPDDASYCSKWTGKSPKQTQFLFHDSKLLRAWKMIIIW